MSMYIGARFWVIPCCVPVASRIGSRPPRPYIATAGVENWWMDRSLDISHRARVLDCTVLLQQYGRAFGVSVR